MSDMAPSWYVEHFRAFGYAADDLQDTWSRLSEGAREDYSQRLRGDR